jgi:galactokinase
MMGGGFGGCTINLVRTEEVEQVIERVSKEYRQQTGIDTVSYIVEISNGTSVISR